MNSHKVPSDSAMVAQNISIAATIVQESSAEGSPFLREYAIYEINTILWALLIVVTGVLLKRVAQVFWLWVLGSRLPGPRSSAFFGYSSCIAKAGGRDGFTALLSELHKEYGHVVRLWLGPTQLLVSIKDDSLVEEVLLRARDRLPNTGKALHIAYGSSTVFSAPFTEAKKRRLAFNDLNEKVIGSVEAICRKVTEQLKNREGIGCNGAEIDCKSLAQHLAVSVLGAALFGESFLSWPAMDEFKQLLLMIANEARLWANFSVMPLWNKKFQMYRKNCFKLQQLTEDILAQCRQQQGPPCAPKCTGLAGSKSGPETSTSLKLTGCKRTEGDLPEEMISGLTKCCEWFGPSKSVEELRGSLISLMFHGSLSTAGILSGALTWLAQYSSVQAKVHEEIDKICTGNRPPMVDDVKNMHYLMATLHETARLLPSGPLLQRCSLLQDLRLSQGLTVPAGAILAIPVQLIQMEDCTWGADADAFNPERFLCRSPCVEGKNSSLKEKKPSTKGHVWQSAEYTSGGGERESSGGEGVDGMDVNDQIFFKDPSRSSSFLLFGAGSRSCVGRNFAIIEMMMLLATLLQEFKVKLGSGGGEKLEPKIENCILHLSPSPKLMFEPRQCH